MYKATAGLRVFAKIRRNNERFWTEVQSVSDDGIVTARVDSECIVDANPRYNEIINYHMDEPAEVRQMEVH